MQPIRPNVSRLLPLSKQDYLDESVYQIFSRTPELRDVGYKLASPPYRCDLLGFLIQMTEDEVITSFPFIDHHILELMKQHLAVADLSFGTHVPQFWQRPATSFAL